MRALHIVSGDLWAGAEVQVFQLLREFQRVSTVTPRAIVLNPGLLADRLSETGVEVTVLDESRLGFLALLRELKQVIVHWQPDVVHTHRRKEHILGGLAARARGIAAVATVHGRSEFAFPWWHARQRMLAGAERLVLNRVHRYVIAVSSDLAGHLALARKKIRVVPNGVDIDTIRRLASEAPAITPGRGRHTLAFLGRLVPVKRVDRLIDALALLDAREPGAWRLWIIGDGPERHALEQHARGIGVADWVDFTGFLSNPLPLLKQVDALVFASDHEGLPMTALEALALGVPVVSPQIGGLTELIKDAGHGGLAKENSAEALAKAISSFVDHSANAGDALSNRLPARCTVSETASKTIQLYANVAGFSVGPQVCESASA